MQLCRCAAGVWKKSNAVSYFTKASVSLEIHQEYHFLSKQNILLFDIIVWILEAVAALSKPGVIIYNGGVSLFTEAWHIGASNASSCSSCS